MAYKTEHSNCYNEDDFVQDEHGGLKELTVTITLCEYRNLIRELANQEAAIERLHEEKTELENRCLSLENTLAIREVFYTEEQEE